MLQKWKLIINNWINCYSDDTTEGVRNVNNDSLLTIISHLRENLNLDESKSSVLEALTVEEFILEKYPGFKFKNGTVKASNGDDIYLGASLLLFFVCVNSKNVDIKSVMCNKLSGDDQEIIMKFSKALMECSLITCDDIQTAITEACGIDMATIDIGQAKVAVAETPPALRSLHGEVRRLQAALDAECFDRNFLQEELTRTNFRLEKLVKDKEQYKLEIMDLKAKISLCCRGDHDSEQMENDEKHSTKLARQLQDMEERLVKVQDQLEETVYENDSLKSKLEGLKEDRDKWLALSQQESARAAQLAEELETERRQMQSLRELVSELRQHNRLNRFDSSLLECDDPDASIQSLGHNLSICSEACVNVIEVQLSEERAKVDALKLQIETLQKENEQLHFAIEEDNSNHELILKEKDGIIDNLEQQLREQKTLLESLRKDHEDITLSWEKHKLKTREIIEVKDERIRKLNDHLGSLKQEFTDLKNVNDELTNKIDVIQNEAADSERTYKEEIESVVQLLTQEKTKNDIITNEMQMLQNRLSEQTSAIDILTTDKNKLEEAYEVVLAKNTEISDDKMILAHQLAEEKSLRQILEEEKKALSTQNAVNEKKYSKQIKQIEKKLSKEVGKTKAIIQDKECLAQQLIEQKSAKELADKEKENILLEKSVVVENLNKLNIELSEQINQLINKQTSLEQQCSAEKAIAEVLNEEKKLLIKTLEEEKLSNEVLLKDKECLVMENNSLKHDILEQKTAQEVLLNDMQLLMVQKEDFVKSLEFEKSVRDEIENEKNGLRKELKEVEEQYTCELKSKEVELENVAEDIKRLHIKLEDQRELNKQISVVLNVGLEKLKEGINQEKFTSNILQNVINCNDTISTVDKCDLLINIANTLNTIVITKMKALQLNNSTLKSLKEVSKQSEMEICKLQTVIIETNNELSKQNETYTNTLDSQLKEIKTLQQENQNLTNELNTLKIQLEVKVHSLKEKLVEQENATDDLKKGYECQIDNLNIMITNLNKYLKDKTLALELTVNEKNQLKQIVAENDKVINCLKEELETMTQNLERVTSEFESEKLVLENMATVTESVMEDQKVAFNETIAELSNAQKLLQDENATIKDRLENERREFELKIQEKETALELKHQELIELQHSKEDVEEGKILHQKTSDKEITVLKNDILKKENEMVKLKEELHEMNEIKSQKSVLEEEIIVIKADIKSKEEELEKTVQEKNTLENVIRNYEEDVVSLQKQNIDLKIKIDAFEREYHNKVDTLTDSLKEEVAYKKDLNAKLSEKVETILVMENKIKYLEDELNTLKQEKSEVEDSYLAKIGELQTTLQMNSLTNDEEIKKIKEYSMELEQQSFELNRDKTALKENINTLNKNNMDLEENIGQERRIKEELEQYICELRKSIANLQENISVLNDANTELKNEKDKLEQYILKLEKSIAVLKEDVTDLINANTELEQDRLKLKLHGTELKESANNLKLFNTELVEEFNKLKKAHDELSDRFSKEKTAKEEHNKQISNTLCMGLTKLIQDLKKEGIANETLQQLFDVEKDDISVIDKCDMLINIANMVTAEVVMRKNLEKALEHEDAALAELKQVVQQKEVQIFELQSEIKRLKQVVNETKIEMSKQNAMHTTTLDNKSREMQLLQQENTSLTNDLTDVKIQLEVKVHSLKEKLIDSENLTDKLKKSYDCQIENLNIMITKLTNYLKDKTLELEVARKEKERLQQITEVNNKAIKSLEEEVKSEKLRQEKLMTDFESERMVIKNMVTVTESVMEDQKTTFNTTVLEKEKAIELLQEEISNQKRAFELKLKEKDTAIELVQKELVEMRLVKGSLEAEITLQKETLDSEMNLLKIDIQKKEGEVTKLNEQNKQLEIMNKNYKDSAESLADQNSELKIMKDAMEVELRDKVEQLTESLQEQIDNKKDLNIELNEKSTTVLELEEKIKRFEEKINILELDKSNLTIEKDDHLVKMKEFETNSLKDAEEISKLLKDNADLSEENDELKKVCKETKEEINVLKKVIAELKEELDKLQQSNAQLLDDIHELNTENLKSAEEVSKLKISNTELVDAIEGNKAEIKKLEEAIKHEQDQYKKLQDDLNNEKVTLVNKCDILQDYHTKAEKELEERQKEIVFLQKEVQTLQAKVEMCVTESVAKDGHISKMSKEKDVVINIVNQELLQEKVLRAKYQKDLEEKIATISELKKNFNELNNEREALKILKKENEELIKAIGLRETFALRSHESTSSRKYSGPIAEKELRDIHHQVDNTSDITHSSIESLKTITDLEKIIHDKNRTITTLQSDVSYLKTLMAESENKLLDVTKELEVTKENCHQLSSQLKKIVHQKNEDIAELKKHVSKMSVTENRATQIIKVSAKYQAIILKRIAEIKSNTVLKELTNFGNSNNNCDSELRRSLSAGSITMEDLENFLETTERHLKKCSEKQMALQKEKDRLTEVNRINESEIINLKKFLTELSVSFQTFSSVKDLYAQKLSSVISMQRTVRREILNLDGHVTDTCMLKLERGYAAVMQDLAECAMNLERWVERCIGRTVSTEKLKQAFLNDSERTSLAPSTVQNAGLEVQLDELENSFQKLLEEVSRAPKGDGARDAQAVTLMEVRAEYEDKLNRMKAKMKQLYTEQIAVFKEKQKEEIALLERELARARDTLSQSSRAYEDHIRGLTSELWSVGEKFLMQKDEAKFLRRKQQSGSLMSLQHVHSSGLVPPQEEPRHSVDTQSLRSLPTSNNGGTKREGRGLHMSDEEGEVFDNRYLQELSTPGRAGLRPGAPAPPERLSELRWRNSLCPPHLKSSYPAETQFAHAVDEEEIKATGGPGGPGAGRPQRKEVGIIAYKKPGPPTPSKQAGRLSATDSELRESLRVEADPQPSRKTSTPSRIRSLFRSSKADNTEGTPRSRRLSNIFRKK